MLIAPSIQATGKMDNLIRRRFIMITMISVIGCGQKVNSELIEDGNDSTSLLEQANKSEDVISNANKGAKEELEKLFFHLPLDSDKYETRKALNGNKNFINVTKFLSLQRAFACDFKEHGALEHLGTYKDPHLTIWFDESNTRTRSRGINLKFYPSEVNECDVQFKQLIEKFQLISYRAKFYDINRHYYENGTDINTGEKKGEGCRFYADESRYQNDGYYLSITMVEMFDGTYYELRIDYMERFL